MADKERMKTLTIIAGARPNFMKIAPIIEAIRQEQKAGRDIRYRLVHTGQHYDKAMSGVFFEELDIPEPDVNLGCGGGTQAEQAASIMVAFEKELLANPCDCVVVVGDVTSTMACTLVAKKLNTRVAHVEAGIRSWDMTMPEEINRIVTDSLADFFFTTTEVAGQNLRKLGVPEDKIFFVGNVMIDTLLKQRDHFRRPVEYDRLTLEAGRYLMLTLHRPANVDEADKLKRTIQAITDNTRGLPVVFPIHPRTATVFRQQGIVADNLKVIDPQGYLEFNYLVQHSLAVITDSGGITEETTVMHIPCMTLRDNTERPETCTIGTNLLVGTNPDNIKSALEKLFSGQWAKGGIPALWDGHAAERIVNHLIRKLSWQQQ